MGLPSTSEVSDPGRNERPPPTPGKPGSLGLDKDLQPLKEMRLSLWVFCTRRVFLSTLLVSEHSGS